MSVDSGYVTASVLFNDANGKRLKTVQMEGHTTVAQLQSPGYPVKIASFSGTVGTAEIVIANLGLSFQRQYKDVDGKPVSGSTFSGGYLDGVAFSCDGDGARVTLLDETGSPAAVVNSRYGKVAVDSGRHFAPLIKIAATGGTGNYRLIIWGI